jgi:radical SAM superfamily enzyme YgiQ (UPF0313 family)
MTAKKRILLIMPEWRLTTSRWSLNNHPYIKKRAFIPPISLAIIAAVTPDNFEVDIWDESVHGFIDKETRFPVSYEIVGIGGYFTHFFRAVAIANFFKKRGVLVVVGGAGVTASPQAYRDHFDVMILGESENIWPRFLHDFLAGSYKKRYKDKNLVDISLSPKPKWGNIKALMLDNYAVGAIQTSRGCPFRCEFCNVWKVFGRKMRTKTKQQVIEEIEEISDAGMKHIAFCEDNFFGNPKYTKEILRALIDLNKTQTVPLYYYTEISINIASDDEVLKMLADAGFAGLFIGVESPSRDSLSESKKVQNLKGDLIENCNKIQSYGLPVEASMIVGFDHDDEGIFDMQFEFLQKACIPYPRMRMLQARAGTETFGKLMRENRVLDTSKLHSEGTYFDMYLIPNIIPAKMTRISLFEHYIELLERLYDWDNFTERMIGFIDIIVYIPERDRKPEVRDPDRKLPQELTNFISLLGEKERQCVVKILNHTANKAPHQLYNVVSIIVRQQLEAQNLEITRKSIMNQIEFERNLDLSKFILKDSTVDGTV